LIKNNISLFLNNFQERKSLILVLTEKYNCSCERLPARKALSLVRNYLMSCSVMPRFSYFEFVCLFYVTAATILKVMFFDGGGRLFHQIL